MGNVRARCANPRRYLQIMQLHVWVAHFDMNFKWPDTISFLTPRYHRRQSRMSEHTRPGHHARELETFYRINRQFQSHLKLDILNLFHNESWIKIIFEEPSILLSPQFQSKWGEWVVLQSGTCVISCCPFGRWCVSGVMGGEASP